ncbi:MAG: gamma-glutamyl-phosphate reductase, partial [Desulfobacteraceae bacterium]|nr:gamma-glutamyl-phosphate reductase [Desulfobacteraceae bacterium]
MSLETSESLETIIIQIAENARKAARTMAAVSSNQKNKALVTIAGLIKKNAPAIQAENAKDIEQAKKNGLTPAMIDRLTITDNVIESMAQGLIFVAGLEDPVGSLSDSSIRPNKLEIA